MQGLAQSLCDGRGRDHSGERETVAHTLSHGHDVRSHAVALEPPEMFAGSAETSLHLIGDADASVNSDELVRLLEEALGELDRTSDPLNGLCEQPRHLAAREGVLEHLLQLFVVLVCRLALVRRTRAVASRLHGGVPAVFPAPQALVRVGVHRVVHALRNGYVEPPRGLRRDAHHVGAHAVVAVAERDEVELLRVQAGEQHGQVVGFRAAVDEVHDLEIPWHFISEPLRVLVDLRVHVDVGGVPEGVHLRCGRRSHFRVAVSHTNCDDAAEEVEVASPRLVKQPLHVALVDEQGLLVV